jgi:asparagine synthase (glutamine-hydrolysing)
MCGILLVVRKDDSGLSKSECLDALSLIENRGPDYTVKKFINEDIFFAQTILSITGSNNKGSGDHLRSDSGRFEILFNGEIYNYKSLGEKYCSNENINPYRSIDSNVLVNLFDVLEFRDVTKQLDGMYAFTLLDNAKKTITISRDPQGEKSLYIYEDRSVLIISSTIPPILKLVKDISYDHQTIRNYFKSRHFMFEEDTPYSGIKQLRPGESRVLNLENMSWTTLEQRTIMDWVSADSFHMMRSMTMDEATDKLDAIMSSCAQDMIPDTKFASVVSGGIDSSLISSYLIEKNDPDILIAINHVGKDYISDDLRLFEKSLGREIKVIDVDLERYGKEIIKCQKELCGPLFSHSFVGQSILSEDINSSGCKVLFGGEAADELFGGYGCYYNFNDKGGIYKESPSDYTRYSESEINFFEDEPMDYKKELRMHWENCLKAYSHFQEGTELNLQAMMLFDAAYQLSAVGLRGADIMSSMWGIESRSMFVRRPIIEFILNMPIGFKVNQQEVNDITGTKTLLKNLFSRKFPEIDIQKKQGFAGFPNESIKFLGNYEEFKIFDILGFRDNRLSIHSLSRDIGWKIINLEYFFRNNPLSKD